MQGRAAPRAALHPRRPRMEWFPKPGRRPERRIGMTVCRRIYEASREKAGSVEVEALSIGLGCTAVATTDGGLGLPCTASGPKTARSVLGPDEDYEGARRRSSWSGCCLPTPCGGAWQPVEKQEWGRRPRRGAMGKAQQPHGL